MESFDQDSDFKERVIHFFNTDIHPLLIANGFKKSTSRLYTKEENGLFQAIYFEISKYSFESRAYYSPTYFVRKNARTFGGDIAFVTPKHMFTKDQKNVHFEKELDKYILNLNERLEKVLSNLNLVFFPECKDINSIDLFFSELIKLKDSKPVFFGEIFSLILYHSNKLSGIPVYDLDYKDNLHILDVYMFSIFYCFCRDFQKGVEGLIYFSKHCEGSGFYSESLDNANIILAALKKNNSKKEFMKEYNRICNVVRKNYKLPQLDVLDEYQVN